MIAINVLGLINARAQHLFETLPPVITQNRVWVTQEKLIRDTYGLFRSLKRTVRVDASEWQNKTVVTPRDMAYCHQEAKTQITEELRRQAQ